MALNDDILDAIRNRRYSLRRIDKTAPTSLSMKRIDEDSIFVAKILERRVRMEFSDDSDGDDGDVCSRNFYS